MAHGLAQLDLIIRPVELARLILAASALSASVVAGVAGGVAGVAGRCGYVGGDGGGAAVKEKPSARVRTL